MIPCCLNKEPLPVYGTGRNVRDWLYVDDHAEALWMILRERANGEKCSTSAEIVKNKTSNFWRSSSL